MFFSLASLICIIDKPRAITVYQNAEQKKGRLWMPEANSNIFQKLGVDSRVEAVKAALEQKLV